jgi:hypothetical protein
MVLNEPARADTALSGTFVITAEELQIVDRAILSQSDGRSLQTWRSNKLINSEAPPGSLARQLLAAQI